MKMLDPEFMRRFYPGISGHLIRSYRNLFGDREPESFGWWQYLILKSYFLYKKWWEDPLYFLTRRRPEFFRNGHVLDVGACIGYTAELLGRTTQDGYRVYAFEPEPTNQRTLRYWIRRNELESRIVPVAAAVGSSSGEVELWRNQIHHGDHRIATPELKAYDPDSADLLRVKQWSLDDFCREQGIAGRIAFVKMDVQGYEIEVLKGMRQIAAANPRLVAAVEYSPDCFEVLGQNEDEFFQVIGDFGWEAHQLLKGGKTAPFGRSELRALCGKKGYLDLLCARPGVIVDGGK